MSDGTSSSSQAITILVMTKLEFKGLQLLVQCPIHMQLREPRGESPNFGKRFLKEIATSYKAQIGTSMTHMINMPTQINLHKYKLLSVL